METISASLALCAGNSPVTGEFPHKGQWRVALKLSLICAWINDWVNNRETGDLKRHRPIMTSLQWVNEPHKSTAVISIQYIRHTLLDPVLLTIISAPAIEFRTCINNDIHIAECGVFVHQCPTPTLKLGYWWVIILSLLHNYHFYLNPLFIWVNWQHRHMHVGIQSVDEMLVYSLW